MKQHYLSPSTDLVNVNLESRFLDSAWYTQGGQGDFIYIIEDPDEDAWG